MNISLAWIFDHIDADWKKQDVKNIVSRFNQVTAEIEGTKKIAIDISPLYMGQVISTGKEKATVTIAEKKEEITLPARDGAHSRFLIYKIADGYRWATCKNVGLDKEGLLPAFDVSDADMKGAWRKTFEAEDIIFDVDNKSLTHRPDMWGYRGFAREVAAYLQLPFRDKKQYLSEVSVQNFAKKSKATEKSPCTIEIKAPDACKRFSGLYIKSIENRASNIRIASRLIKVGVRPINGIVDLTNYVMLDWSQPVHAYDAKKIVKQQFIARMASDGETLTLLDGSELKLSSNDLVIADGEKAVGLAGVMGGLHDSIGEDTKAILFESAHFSPVCIRRTSMRHGIRTDSSSRFEKTLDPNQITDAIARFIALAEETGLNPAFSGDIMCVGKAFEEQTIGVMHSFLERRSGVRFETSDIVEPLTRIGFTVVESAQLIDEKDDVLYTITIPSFRGAKDVSIKEDILEEVIRFFGFNNIALELPSLTERAFDKTTLFRERKIREFLVRAARMTQQMNYLYYDEAFLREVGLAFDDCLSITNPVSENNMRLASTLLPNLFKDIKHDCPNEERMRFFEIGRAVRVVKDSVEEKKMLSGIFFEKRKPVDFYECKQYILDVLHLCGMDDVEFKQVDEASRERPRRERPWVMPYQSAELFYEKTKLGIVGKVDSAFLSKLGGLDESEAFFFELDLERLLAFEKEDVTYTPISKFQGVHFDLCFMAPLALQAIKLEGALRESDDLIERVELVDFFDKPDWVDQRSVAFRLWVSHPEKTLKKEEIDAVRENALKSADTLGAQLRK